MLKFLTDENFNGDIVRGLFLRCPDLDLVRVQDVGLQEGDDPTILEWAAINQRIVLTHDRATMPDFAYQRLLKEQLMSGVFVILPLEKNNSGQFIQKQPQSVLTDFSY